MRRVFWMALQAAIFFGSSFLAYDAVVRGNGGRPDSSAALGSFGVGLLVTVAFATATLRTGALLRRWRDRRLARDIRRFEERADQGIAERTLLDAPGKLFDLPDARLPRKQQLR